ncbi:AbrB/MazE/SpoVT family DNA-binding domain-containing protein [Candidatus Gottesmanbacteria bacterium]|nr:AbrB/MazE/SpoVT family DNA-binding domain-containing protein [Candidatus Gottesmanbacteria bacterium]
MLQTIIQVGNSLAITLPKAFTLKAKFKAGDQVLVEANPDIPAVYVRKAKADAIPTLTPEFKSWLDDVIKEDADIIKALAAV